MYVFRVSMKKNVKNDRAGDIGFILIIPRVRSNIMHMQRVLFKELKC